VIFLFTLISEAKARVHLEDSMKIKMYSFFSSAFLESLKSICGPNLEFLNWLEHGGIWDHNHGFPHSSIFLKEPSLHYVTRISLFIHSANIYWVSAKLSMRHWAAGIVSYQANFCLHGVYISSGICSWL